MANVTENRINKTLEKADLDSINQHFTGISDTLDAYTQPLTDEERNSLFGLDEANLVFVQDTLIQGQLLMDKLSPESQAIVNNMATDLSLWGSFDNLFNGQLADITQRVEDTRRLAAHESYTAALALYKIFQAMAEVGVEGFQAPADLLESRFAGQGVGRQQVPDL